MNGLLFAGLVLGAAAQAQEPAACALHREEPVRGPGECESLFGHEEEWRRNERHRRRVLVGVSAMDDDIWIIHRSDWADPEPLRFSDLVLRDVVLRPNCPAVAIFAVGDDHEPAVEDLGCEPGLYAVRVDTSLGDRAQVMAILSQGVLIEDEGQLAYVTVEDHAGFVDQEVQFRMVWRAPFTLPRPLHSAPPAKKKQRAKKSSRRR